MNSADCIRRVLQLLVVGCCAVPKCYDDQYLTPLAEDTAEQQTIDEVSVPFSPNYLSEYPISLTRADGIDLLIVIDNGPGMYEAQCRVSDAVAVLIDLMTAPPPNVWHWGLPPVSDLRIAVVSADMGLQAGGTVNTRQVDVETCENPVGDNGQFLDIKDGVETAFLNGNAVQCDNAEQPVEVACKIQQGTDGCIISQPLEAMVRGLESFILDNHALAVLVVTDDDDCSMADAALLDASEWADPATVRTACFATPTNESLLFDTTRYIEKLRELKNGDLNRVVFAAVAGTSPSDGCEGDGVRLTALECLSSPSMTRQVTPLNPEGTISGWAASCVTNGIFPQDAERGYNTVATPGRRLMDTARQLGRNGFMYSICSNNWSTQFATMGKTIAAKTDPLCLPKGLPWSLVDNSCIACGQVTQACDLFLELNKQKNPMCPAALYEGLDRNLSAEIVVRIHEGEGQDGLPALFCPVPKLSTPIECAGSDKSVVWESHTGWVFCFEDGECAYRLRLTDSVQTFAEETANRMVIKCESPY